MWTNCNLLDSPLSLYFGDFAVDSHYRPSKRKSNWLFDVSPIETRPSKILVTEELMASQLQDLHLSSSYTTHGSQQLIDEAGPSTRGISDDNIDFGQFNLPKLTLCDELRALNDSISIIPEVLQTQKPSTALMLWQPPAGSLGSELKSHMKKSTSRNSEEEKKKENALEVVNSKESTNERVDFAKPMSVSDGNGMEVELLNNNNDLSMGHNEMSRAV